MTKKPFYTIDNFHCRKSVGYLVRRLHQLMVPQAEARFAAAEISFTQWVVLMGLREGLTLTCADIARHLGHDTGATTRLLDQMEERGLIARNRDKDDRRVVNITLLPKGRAMTLTLGPHLVDFWNEMLDEFSSAETAALIDLLTRLLTKIESKTAPETTSARAKPRS